MNEITILIIGIGIGYFWALYRVENFSVKVKTTVKMDAQDFWNRAEIWRNHADRKQRELEAEATSE